MVAYVCMNTALVMHQYVVQNWMEKASFARIVGAERRAAHFKQKAVLKK